MAPAYRTLGTTGIQVSPIMFGGNVFGWTADESTSFKLLDAWVDAGFNFIDTADMYSVWVPGHQGGESETILGKWFQQSGKRNKVVIATKVGMELSPEKKGLKAAYIARAVEDSLRRLQTDVIDLYQSHKDDESTPLEETLGAYEKLIKAGKVRAIGASNYTAARLQEALDVSRRTGLPAYQTMQPEYNLMERHGYEDELEGVCEKNHLGVVTYFSLASGFLSGKYRSKEDVTKRGGKRGAAVEKYINDRGLKVLAALDQVAKEINSKPAQVAIAWLIARPSVTTPIASATSLDQLQDLVGAANLKLTTEQVKSLDAASA